MSLHRNLAFAGVMLVGAALVGWWCVASKAIRLDSPFASPGFGTYFLFALAGEFVLGLPYGLTVRAALRRFDLWDIRTMLAAAALPGVLLMLFDRPLGGAGLLLGACTLIAGLTMALGWHLLHFDAPRQGSHG